METLLRDIRHGKQMLLRHPGFAVLVVLTLALGIGANSAVFSVVNAVLLRPLPYRAPDRLVIPWGDAPKLGFAEVPLSDPNFSDWKRQSTVFDGFAAFTPQPAILTGAGEPEQLKAAAVTTDLFSVLGVQPAMGRSFRAAEGVPGGPKVVILSHGLWARRFGSRPDLVGGTIHLDGAPYEVLGIMPEGIPFPQPFTAVGSQVSAADLFLPLVLVDTPDQRGNHRLFPVARLKPGATVEQAQAELRTIASHLEQQFPDADKGFGVRVVSLSDQVVGGVRPMLLLLLGAVGFVLLIACANVANLMLTRALAREKEFIIRTAVGANRKRLIRQLVAESLPLCLLGGALGLLVSYWGIRALVAFSPGDIPRLQETSVDLRVLGFTLLLSLLTSFLFGLLPALHAARTNLIESLRDGGRATSSRSSNATRKTLGTVEIALALVLLIGAGLMIKSLYKLTSVEPGFRAGGVLTAELSPPRSRYAKAPEIQAFYDNLLQRVRALPSVRSAGAVTLLPLGGADSSTGFLVQGKEPQPGETWQLHNRTATPGYFSSLGIPILQGRDFGAQDLKDSPRVIIINQTLAKQIWPTESAIGKRMAIDFEADDLGRDRAWREVVGVVADVKHSGLTAAAQPETFSPLLQSSARRMNLVVRSSGEPEQLIPTLRGIVREIDPDLAISRITPMEDLLAQSVAQPRFSMFLLILFSVLAVVLGAVGIYGVMSYLVEQRLHEIGIRIALGATRGDVIKMIVRQGLYLLLAGAVAGLVVSAFLSRVVSSLLYEVRPTDPLTMLLATLTVAFVVVAACLIPARRASRIDPLLAIRG
jgi:predicted permease